MNDTIFALDIGTRSVVGIILKGHEHHFEIVDIEIVEHSERSMLDGQIHDIVAVSNVIEKIKLTLEQKHGPLQKVCVAAAGRALKTEIAKETINILGKPMMTKEDILHFELQAVQQAQRVIASNFNNKNGQQYYCVGYSVLHYHLDNEEIGNLIDQQGQEATVEVIATFLPKVVVESLIAALNRAGLEMDALTLEPIAAINVLIPQSMRRLNVALVDIGAGTSDIAITDRGTVTAYGMVPVAGDEITEAISEEFLLDFPLAEKAKRDLFQNEEVIISDILGFQSTISRLEFIERISESIDKLVSKISNELLQLNGKSPKAVMLVGGGSLTPELPKRLARKLNLPENRVAIRGIDAIANLTISENIHKGPELVTPIGIAMLAKQSPVQYINVTINEQTIRLFDLKELTVGDCLLAAGIQMNKLYGKPGMAIIVQVNGKKVTIPGKYGESPTLLKNGEPCRLDDPICNHDRLRVEKGKDGTSTIITTRQLLDELPVKLVMINGSSYTIQAKVYQNNKLTNFDQAVFDHDDIYWSYPETIRDLLDDLHLDNFRNCTKPYTLSIDGREISFPQFSGHIKRNGIELPEDFLYQSGDCFEITSPQEPTIRQLAESLKIELYEYMPVQFNSEMISLRKNKHEFYKAEILLDVNDVIHFEDSITIKEIKNEPFIFQDIFIVVNIDIPKGATGGFKLLKNELEVTFYEPLVPGDSLAIVWPTTEAKILKN